MKFGKQILATSESSKELCSTDLWLDYKGLKKCIKKIPSSIKKKVTDGESPKRLIQTSPEERVFFVLLRQELKKVAASFLKLQYSALRKVVAANVSCRMATQQGRARDALEETLSFLTSTHLSLLMLENYAVMNYAGFVKILKKHDKVTGFQTKDSFLLKLVNDQPFVLHPWLKSAIRMIEDEFKKTKAIFQKRFAEAEVIKNPSNQTKRTAASLTGKPRERPKGGHSTASNSSPSRSTGPLSSTTLGTSPARSTVSPNDLAKANMMKQVNSSPWLGSSVGAFIASHGNQPELHKLLYQYHSLLQNPALSQANWLSNLLLRPGIPLTSNPSTEPNGSDSTNSDENSRKPRATAVPALNINSMATQPFSLSHTLESLAHVATSGRTSFASSSSNTVLSPDLVQMIEKRQNEARQKSGNLDDDAEDVKAPSPKKRKRK